MNLRPPPAVTILRARTALTVSTRYCMCKLRFGYIRVQTRRIIKYMYFDAFWWRKCLLFHRILVSKWMMTTVACFLFRIMVLICLVF